MGRLMRHLPVLAVASIPLISVAHAQTAERSANAEQLGRLRKEVDDLRWLLMLSDVATVDKVRLTSETPSKTGQRSGAGLAMTIHAYTFVPKTIAPGTRVPLIVFVHGGFNGDFNTGHAHIVRELMGQGYVVVAPEFRGSEGYGASYYDASDYGGAELQDTYAARNWAVEMMPSVDPERVGIMGWSHGGYHALMNVLLWPTAYKVAFAGEPVTDLVLRNHLNGPAYAERMARSIGKTMAEDLQEYRRRSPTFHAAKLEVPLLLHATTNGMIREAEAFISALRAARRPFEQRIFQDAPGDHSFGLLDTPVAHEARREIYAFLAKYLKK
jgi:dipeptidyl aminopeptidase/acylaminoacyl peptidase